MYCKVIHTYNAAMLDHYWLADYVFKLSCLCFSRVRVEPLVQPDQSGRLGVLVDMGHQASLAEKDPKDPEARPAFQDRLDFR